MEQPHLAASIYSQGYLSVVESLIEKSVKLLALEASTQQSKELYRLVIEQAFRNLEDLVSFLDASSELEELTNSPLVAKSFLLMSDPTYQSLLASTPLMTQISSFFMQLSEDNSYLKLTEPMRVFV
jgi:hypothetical protein